MKMLFQLNKRFATMAIAAFLLPETKGKVLAA